MVKEVKTLTHCIQEQLLNNIKYPKDRRFTITSYFKCVLVSDSNRSDSLTYIQLILSAI